MTILTLKLDQEAETIEIFEDDELIFKGETSIDDFTTGKPEDYMLLSRYVVDGKPVYKFHFER